MKWLCRIGWHKRVYFAEIVAAGLRIWHCPRCKTQGASETKKLKGEA